MAKADKDQPVYAFIRKGNSLIPEMEMDIHALDGITQSQRVKLDIKNFRNLDRLRAYWATLHECIDATGCAPNVRSFHSAIKLQTDHVELVRLKNGLTVAVPASIAFENMTEAEMVTFFMASEQFLATEYGFSSEYGS
ncbi:MAG: hypothetical protein GY941_01070 [Planctomycetes bacterium]|nr:hypothetical protein [Planctomycetota bacterium]